MTSFVNQCKQMLDKSNNSNETNETIDSNWSMCTSSVSTTFTPPVVVSPFELCPCFDCCHFAPSQQQSSEQSANSSETPVLKKKSSPSSKSSSLERKVFLLERQVSIQKDIISALFELKSVANELAILN